MSVGGAASEINNPSYTLKRDGGSEIQKSFLVIITKYGFPISE